MTAWPCHGVEERLLSAEDALFRPRPLEAAEMAKMPIFPLPNTVLFPHTFLPLHIFEPRYRVMIRQALAEGGSLGLAMLKPGSEDAPDTRPPVFTIGGAGRIVHHTELADGRYMILLRGVTRIKLEKEIEGSDEPFRRFSVSPLDEVPMPEGPAVEAMKTLQNCVNQLAVNMSEGGAELLKAVALATQPGELSDLLASALIGEPELQQSLLEQLHVNKRVERIVNTMAELLLSMPDGEKSDEGPILN